MNCDHATESHLSRRLRWAALVCCAISLIVASMGLLGYLPGMRLLGSVHSAYIPMAPSTALSFIALSLILGLYSHRPPTGALHVGCLLMAGLISLFGFLKFGEHFTSAGASFEHLFVPALDTVGGIPVGIMSYSTGLGFFVAGIGVLICAVKSSLEKEARGVGFSVGAAGSFVTFASILMLFGYIYKQPFLYGRDSVVPMALTTAIAFLFLGLAIITGNGPGQLFTRFFAGTSTRSRLLRVFIPLIIFFILVKDGLGALIEANAATLMTLTLLVFMAVTSMVVYWIAGVIGRSIDSAEDDLRESEARFRSVFDQAAVGVARLAADGTWLSVNKKLCDIVGYSHKELLSKTFQEITHPDDLETDLGYLQQLLEDEIQTYSMEKRYYKKSGDLVWINLTVSLVRDINHTPDYLVAIIEDITERKQAEQKLRQSEADLRDAQRMAKMGRWELDIASHRLAWSDSIFEIFEIDPAQFGASYEAFMETVHPEDRTSVERAYAASLEQRTPYEITHRLLMKDGRIKWLHELCRTEYDSHGESVRSIGVVRDVTQGKEADERLKNSEKRNRAYLENSPACTKIVDLDFNLQYMSHAGITGLNIDNIEEYYGKPYPLEFYPDSFKVPMRRNLRRAKESGEIITQEAPVVDVDGNELWFHSTIVPVKDDDGLLEYLMVVSIDTTERKQAEAEKDRLTAAVEQSAESIVITNAEGAIKYVNPAFERITGYSRAEVLEKNPRILKSGKQDKAFYAELWRTIASGNIWRGQMVNRRKNGVFYTESNVISSVKDSEGKIVNFVAVKTDVTQELLREEKSRQALKMEAIGQLAGGIAHDFNNQLAGILGYAEVLLDSLEDEQQIADASLIKEGALRAADLTAQLLAFSHKGKALSAPVNIHKLIAEVAGILEHSINKQITIKQTLQADPETTRGDPSQLQNALLNLALNARDAMPDGGKLTFETAVAELDETFFQDHPMEVRPGTYLVITVSDNGCGMDAETQKHIFEPFYTTKDVGEGTGMGLASVYGTIHNHKGLISVYSEVGQGTTFRVYLPLIEDAQRQKQTENKGRPLAGTARILLVDDEELIRKFVTRALERLGYHVITCSDGKEAVDCYEKSWDEIDLVLLDMIMPEMGGREAFALMKEINPAILAILSSGYSIDGEAQTILEGGVKAFIRKPYQLIDLSEKVAEVLQAAGRTP